MIREFFRVEGRPIVGRVIAGGIVAALYALVQSCAR